MSNMSKGRRDESRAARVRRPVGEHYPGDLARALLDVAVIALEEHGADRLSLRDVARRIGVSHAAPAHHYGDRAGLLTAVAVDGFVRFARVIRAATVGDDPVVQLGELTVAYAEFSARHPGHVEVMFRPALLRADDPQLVAAQADALGALRHHLARCQAAGFRPGVDLDVLTLSAWAFAHGVAMLRLQGAFDIHPAAADPRRLAAAITGAAARADG